MEQKKNISRRDFFKRMGAVSVTATGLSACANGEKANPGSAEPTGEMPAETVCASSKAVACSVRKPATRWP